jgi:diguanylate cyclase (GGDEF)-like protein
VQQQRLSSDRRSLEERRRTLDRRTTGATPHGAYRYPTWQEQQVQFITRYMLFADLDKFKAVNDEHGHSAGDRVLQQFAEIVRANTRSSAIAARFGGDEFIVLLEDASLSPAAAVARRIQAQVDDWAHRNNIDFSVTFGLGVAPTHGDSLASLLEQVDRALYHSKITHTSGGLAHAQCPQPSS